MAKQTCEKTRKTKSENKKKKNKKHIEKHGAALHWLATSGHGPALEWLMCSVSLNWRKLVFLFWQKSVANSFLVKGGT